MTEIFEPIRIHYDGRDADRSQMDLLQLGQSITGTARALGIIGNYVHTGRFVRKHSALSVRVLATPPAPGTYEYFALLMSANGALPIHDPKSLSKAAVALFEFLVAVFGGKPKAESTMALDVAKEAIVQAGLTQRAQLEFLSKVSDQLLASQRQNFRAIVSPVGETCDVMTVGNPGDRQVLIDRETRLAIEAVSPPELLKEKNYRVTISEIDLKNHTCKLSVVGDNEDDRYDAQILDPEVKQPEDKYSLAAHKGAPITVRAKVEIRDGDFYKFYISAILEE